MTQLDLMWITIDAYFGRFARRVVRDERGMTAEYIVVTGIALVSAAVVAGILWVKLRDGANDVEVPAPAAP